MNQLKKFNNESHTGQFNYLGRWVDKGTFRAFVYDKNGEAKLANSYDEFQKLTGSGIYFASKKEFVPKEGKNKHGISIPERN